MLDDSMSSAPRGPFVRCSTFLACALVTSSAAAQTRSSLQLRPVVEALHVEPNACFDAATLAPHVVYHLKRSQIDRRLALEFKGDPQADPGITIELRRDGNSVGTRTFPGFALPCDAIRTAIAVTTAMAIDATERERRQTEQRVTAPPQPTADRRKGPSLGHSERAAVGLEALALWGVLPGWTAGFATNFAITLSPAIALRASLFATSHSQLDLDGGKVTFNALAGRLDTCAILNPSARDARALRLRACAGIAVGRLSATGSNFAQATANGEQHRPFLGGLARLDLRIPLGGMLGLTASADLFTRWTDSDVSVAGGESRPLAPIGALFGGGPEIRFW